VSGPFQRREHLEGRVVLALRAGRTELESLEEAARGAVEHHLQHVSDGSRVRPGPDARGAGVAEPPVEGDLGADPREAWPDQLVEVLGEEGLCLSNAPALAPRGLHLEAHEFATKRLSQLDE
jgi:hypothetical protein